MFLTDLSLVTIKGRQEIRIDREIIRGESKRKGKKSREGKRKDEPHLDLSKSGHVSDLGGGLSSLDEVLDDRSKGSGGERHG